MSILNYLFETLFDDSLCEDKEPKVNSTTYDLDTKEGREEAINAVDKLKKNSFFAKYLGIGDETFDLLEDIIRNYEDDKEEEPKEEELKEEPKMIERKVIDKSEKFIRPSEELDNTQIKLNIHKLTEEYVGKYIKPYVDNSKESTNLVNDVYASLYEFACWIYNHK